MSVLKNILKGSASAWALATFVKKSGDTMTGTLQFYKAINPQTGTTYTFVASDYLKIVTANNASAQTYTIPEYDGSDFPVGYKIRVINIGAGTVSFVKATGSTDVVNGNNLLITGGACDIELVAAGVWQISFATAVVNQPAMATMNLDITTSQTKDLWCPQANATLLGIRFRAFSVGTAGTFKLQLNGADITGLTSLVPSTTETYAYCSTSVNLTAGDVITIVADGTLATIADLNITPILTTTQ